jgi:hypothetical protein
MRKPFFAKLRNVFRSLGAASPMVVAPSPIRRSLSWLWSWLWRPRLLGAADRRLAFWVGQWWMSYGPPWVGHHLGTRVSIRNNIQHHFVNYIFTINYCNSFWLCSIVQGLYWLGEQNKDRTRTCNHGIMINWNW